MKEFRYLVKDNKDFSIGLCGETVDAVEGILTLTYAQNEDLKKLIHNGRPDIADMLHLLDLDTADAMVKKGIEHPVKAKLTKEQTDEAAQMKNAPVTALAENNIAAGSAVMDNLTSDAAGTKALQQNDMKPENRHEMDNPKFDPNATQEDK